MALELAGDFHPMNEEEMLAMKEKAMNTEPIFRHPMHG